MSTKIKLNQWSTEVPIEEGQYIYFDPRHKTRELVEADYGLNSKALMFDFLSENQSSYTEEEVKALKRNGLWYKIDVENPEV